MSADDPALVDSGAVTSVAAVALVVAVAVLGVGDVLAMAGDTSPAPAEKPPHSTPINMSKTCNQTDLHVLPAETEKRESDTGYPTNNDSDSVPHEIDSHRDVKQRLLAEFDVGACSGMPTVITEKEVTNSILNHSELTAYIVVHHNVTSQERIYELIQQYKNIDVANVDADTYEFHIRDGECCAITTIHGTYNVTTDSTTVTDKTTKHVPC